MEVVRVMVQAFLISLGLQVAYLLAIWLVRRRWSRKEWCGPMIISNVVMSAMDFVNALVLWQSVTNKGHWYWLMDLFFAIVWLCLLVPRPPRKKKKEVIKEATPKTWSNILINPMPRPA
jgi:hypothetical protein